MNIAEKIRLTRQGKGISQADLADAVGVDITTVWRWEHGRASPVRFIPKLAAALGTTPEYLSGEDTPATPAPDQNASGNATPLHDAPPAPLVYEAPGQRIQIPATPEGYELFKEIMAALLEHGSK